MLNVFLGNRCNFDCDYCLQPKNPIAPVVPDMDKILDYIRANNIREIGYWGGEPLLYWDTIKTVHNFFLAAGLQFDKVIMITNGSLLDQEKVQYLNENNFYVCLSEHSEYGAARWEAFSNIKKSSISFLIRRGNVNLWQFREFVAALGRTFNRQFYTAVGYVRATPDCPGEYYLTHEDVKIHMAHLRDLEKLRERGDFFAEQFFSQQLKRWKDAFSKPATQNSFCCHEGKLTTDLAGNVYPCHYCANIENRIGTLDGYVPPPMTRQYIESEKCQECEAAPWCQGNCYLSTTHEVDCFLALEQHKLFKELSV